MKKTLLTLVSLASIGAAVAQQVPSPSWTITQNSNFTVVSAGVKYLDAVDKNTVWMCGYDGATPSRNYNFWAKSTDGGTTFTSGNIFPDTNTYVLANLEGIDGCNAWVSAYMKSSQDRGVVYHTTNGGTSWTNGGAANMFTVAGSSFADFVSFLTPKNGIALGDPVAGEFEIYRTTDGGTTWTAVPGANIPNPLGGEFGLVNVYTKQGTTNYWYGTNMNRVYRSTDAGQTWSVAAQLTSTIGAVLGINDIAFVDANNGFCEAYFGPTGNGTLTVWNTTDGGATWSMVPTVDPNYGKNDVCAIPGTTYYASAGAGTGNQLISFSQDNGVTWNSWGGSNIQYLKVDFVNPNTGWAGSFASPTLASQGGVYKYNGATLNPAPFASFAKPPCFNYCQGTYTFANQSTGNPAPTYSWSVNAPASVASPTAADGVITFTAAGNYTVSLTAMSGTATSTYAWSFAVTICAGLTENGHASSDVLLYPNPAKDNVTIEMLSGNGKVNYSVVDVLGKTIISESTENQDRININLANQPRGVYFIKVENNGVKTVKKIILE